MTDADDAAGDAPDVPAAHDARRATSDDDARRASSDDARRASSDDALLDAYSEAVIGVVELAGPAVVSLEIGAGGRGKQTGAGSGFVVTPDGYVMTNSHVVSGARTIRVRTQAGEVAEGQLVGDDPATDLALVRVDTAALAILAPAPPGSRTAFDGEVGSRTAGSRTPGAAASTFDATADARTAGSRTPGAAASTFDGAADARTAGSRPHDSDGPQRRAFVPYLPIESARAPRVGQLAVAIGNPLGFDATVSTGVVSALGRSLTGRGNRLIDGVIQHTAPLNPGNSGGPLLDARGRVLGVNTAIIARSQGIGFAIGVDIAGWVLGQLLQHGRVRRAWLGIGAQRRPLDRRLAYHHGLGAAAVEIQSIESSSPASAAGLREGDLLVRFGDQPIESIDQLHRALRAHPANTRVELAIIRRGTRLALVITPRVT